ncbi:MAG: hypothetical protein ISEC1_P0293 [Thiomicrorhabdus sp.]|nr:MAG: hypothetical protein ISEC1_P0293 [Thiomicrorhabdus sp.]
MKKTFKLTHDKIKPARLADAIKHEVKKYLKRERKRVLPKDADFWDFDCRFGADIDNSEVIHVAEINKSIDKAEADAVTSFYLEILAKPATRQVRAEEEYSEDNDFDGEPEEDYIEEAYDEDDK